MKRILYSLLLVLLLGSLLVTGCQLGQEAPTAQGELSLYGIDPITLDPAISGEMLSHEYIMQMFGGLVRLDDDLKPAPDVAERWEVSDDGRTYTFYLRQDVKFHDGREVKAEDVKYSLERACDPATGSMTAATYLIDIVGVKEAMVGRAEEISGVRVLDDYTLQITIDTPKSYFLSKLTYPTAYIVDKDNVESGDEWWRQPNGTGPFKLKEWEENDLLVLERNKRYYGEPAKVKSVVFKLLGGVPMNMYETDEIGVTGVNLLYLDKVTDKTGPFYRELQIKPELSFNYIGFDATKPPFDDVNLRRAFSLAIDKDKIVSLVYRNMLRRADGILPPGMPGFNENLTGSGFDVAKAKELIAGSSYGSVSGLPPITITTAGWGGLIPQGLEAIINEWRENLGVEVTVRQLEPQQFMYHLKEEKDEMFFMGWVADYPHPQDFLEILFHTESDNNYSEYSNPGADDLLDKAGVEMDIDLSLSLYQQAEQMLVDDVACIPLWFRQNYILVKPYIEGYDLNPMGIVMLNKVAIRSD